MSEKYKIGIIGAGGVGLTCAGFMNGAAETIIKTRRPEQARALNEQGVFVTSGEETWNATDFTATAEASDLADCDAVIITVKSYDTESVARELGPVLKPNAEVVTIQNGLQAYDILKQTMPNPERVYAGLTFVGATRDDDTRVTLGRLTKTVIDSAAFKTASALQQSRYDFVASSNVQQDVWDKMALNVGQNALGAITGLNLNDMNLSANCLHIGQMLLNEFEAVANAQGITFEGNLMDKLRANWEGSRHHPSMWQDLDAGKRTEVDAINGAIVEIGKRHGVPAPYNDMITSMIKAIEE